MAKADRVSAILLLFFSGLVILQSRALPYWTADSPGPGFLPFWLGVLLACASAALLARTFAPVAVDRLVFPNREAAFRLTIVVALTITTAALALVVGLVVASGVFMGVTLTYLRPGRARANWATALCTALVVWLLFVRWLAVPLPAGPLGF
jgi:putative tricarboxylic transport membrane protein